MSYFDLTAHLSFTLGQFSTTAEVWIPNQVVIFPEHMQFEPTSPVEKLRGQFYT